MNYDFQNESSLRIPPEAYRPYKRCEFCQSVYLTNNLCEACGRSVNYDLLGPPFGPKSFYGLKERYIKQLPILVTYFPVFENIKSQEAKSLVRQLVKRLKDLTSGQYEEKIKFMIEAQAIVDELLYYGVLPQVVLSYLNNNSQLLTYLQLNEQIIVAKKTWFKELLSYKLAGILRVKFILITASLVLMFFSVIIFSLRYGK